MGLLDGFLPEDTEVRQGLGSSLGALGLALASSPSNAPFQTLPQAFAIMGQQQKAGTSKAALKALLMQAGYSDAEAEKLSSSEGVAKLAIQQKQQQSILGSGGDAEPPLPGMGGSPATPAMSPAAPAGPAAGVSLNGGAPALAGDAGAVQGKFVDALKAGGLTNPNGLAAVAAYGQHESRYDPGNINRTWSDPSESGQAGTSGGLLSWRGDRLANMQKATAGAADPVGAQAQFLLNENPALTQKLQNAKTPEEANALMAEAWKFAGYNRPGTGGEYDQRLATTRSYASRFLGQGQPQTQVADASGSVPAAGVNPTISMPNGRPQVANSEQETQALEGRMGMYPPSVYGITPETQASAAAAQANPADLPAPGAQEAGFVIPPGAATAVEKKVGTPPAPVNENIGPTTQRAQALANFNYWGKRLRASAALGDAGKGLMEEAKMKMGLAQKFLEPTEFDRLSEQAGLSGDALREAAAGAIPGNAPTTTQKEYGSYRKQEVAEGRIPLSQLDYDLKLRREAKADINIRNDAEKKEEVGRAESVTKFLGGIADSAPTTAKRAASLDQLGRLVSRTATAQGTTLKAQLDGIGKELGLSSGELKTKADAINAIVNSLAPQMREPGTGTVSDADLRGFLAALPSLSATPEGNQLILGGLKRAVDVDRERTKIAAQWQAGKLSAAEARSKIAEIDERSIYASEAERSLVQGLSPIPDNKAKPGWRVLGVE